MNGQEILQLGELLSPEDFLQRFTKDGDSWSELMHIYQKNKVPQNGKQTMINDNSFLGEGNSLWWNSILTCPLTKQKYSSCVLAVEQDSEAIQTKYIITSTDYFGERGKNFIIAEGMVFFKKKKMAQKTAALRVLEYIYVAGLDETYYSGKPLLRSSFGEKNLLISNASPEEEEPETDENVVEVVDSQNPYDIECEHEFKSKEALPNVISCLYDLGVRTSKLRIEFNTQDPLTKKEYLSWEVLSSKHPTMIICQLSFQKSPKLTVTSKSSALLKKKAFICAAKQLKDHLIQKSGRLEDVGHEDSRKDKGVDEILILYKIAAIKTLVLPPAFAIQDIYPVSKCGQDSKFSQYYVYEIQVGDECLQFFDTGSGPASGILSRQDIYYGVDSNIEAPIQSMIDLGNVTITKRTPVLISNSDLDSLIKLNTILEYGSEYGRSKVSKDKNRTIDIFKRYDGFVEQAKVDMKSSYLMRTYMLVPLERNHVSTPSHSQTSREVNIDWMLVNSILKNEITSYAKWQSNRVKDHSTSNKGFAFQLTSAQLYTIDVSALSPENSAKKPFPTSDYNSIEDYYLKRHNRQLEHPEAPLIPATEVISMNHEFDTIFTLDQVQRKEFDLVPELTFVFPLPWDFMLMYRLFKKFVIPLERVVELRSVLLRLRRLALKKELEFSIGEIHSRSFSDYYLNLLEEATTVGKYESLEHVGDSVLGFFVALNCFTLNSSMKWDEEDLGEFKQTAVTNEVLSEAGLRIGMDRVICRGGKQWKTCFKGINQAATENCAIMSCNQIAEVVESLLAVAFLTGFRYEDETGDFVRDHWEDAVVIGLLEELQLPMHNAFDLDSEQTWFLSHNSCISAGFDFERNKDWGIQLDCVQNILYSEHGFDIHVCLSDGVDRLLSFLRQLNPCGDWTLSNGQMTKLRVLLSSALFDDSLDNDMDDCPIKNPLVKLSRFRENLFFVGEAALHLALSTDIYRRYPSASAGDLHLMKTCCMADDILTYMMIKHKIAFSLYDGKSSRTESIKTFVEYSDSRGRREWDKNGGWVLDEGQEEFARRWELRWWANTKSNNSVIVAKSDTQPSYPGLGGGRFYGKKSSLGKVLTSDLAYSFKSIVGALVLANGIDFMWLSIVPLFEEILILSPEETRQCYKTDITSTYSEGKNTAHVVGGLKTKHGLGWSAVNTS